MEAQIKFIGPDSLIRSIVKFIKDSGLDINLINYQRWTSRTSVELDNLDKDILSRQLERLKKIEDSMDIILSRGKVTAKYISAIELQSNNISNSIQKIKSNLRNVDQTIDEIKNTFDQCVPHNN